MKKNFRTIISLIVLIVLAISSANIFSFAYFYTNKIKVDNNLNTNLGDKNNDSSIIKVSEPHEFIKAVTDSTYNVSDTVGKYRPTIMLTKNMEITSTIKVTADVNIDLNNFKLTLVYADMVINNYYKSVVEIYGGTIAFDGASARIIANTPNGRVDCSGAKLEGVSLEQVAYSTDMVFDGVVEMLALALESGSTSRKYYQAVQDRNRHCNRHGGFAHDNGCAYISKDIDLPFNYYGYDISISYASSDETVLSNYGEVFKGAINGIADVALIATIVLGGASRQHEFNLHIYDDKDTSISQTVAMVNAVEYLERFYNAELNLYSIANTTQLLAKSFDNLTLLQYESYSIDGALIDSTQNMKGVHFKSDLDSNKLNYVLCPDENLKTLRIAAAGSSNYVEVKVDGQDVSSIKDNYTIAIEVAESMYQRGFEVTKEEGHNGYSKHRLYTTLSSFISDKGISEGNLVDYDKTYNFHFEYQLSYDIDNVYRMGALNDTNKWLYVFNSQNPPTEIQSAGVRMKFTFPTEPLQVSIYLPIKYMPDPESEGNIVAKFWPYYNYFDRLFTSASGGYTYKKFTMPFGYETNGPCYYFEVLKEDGSIDNSIVTQELIYVIDGAEYRKTVAQVVAMSGEELASIMATGQAKWHVSFNISSFTTDNISLSFRYRYKFSQKNNLGDTSYQSSWAGLEDPNYISLLIAPGIIKDYATQLNDCMPNTNLYKYVYNNSRPNKKSAEYIANSQMYILTDWLKKEFINGAGVSEFDNSNNKLNIAGGGYRGIEFIKNVAKVNLNNSGVTVADLNYIGQMRGIEELDLGNNKATIYDRKAGTYDLPSGGNNYFIRKLYPLVNMKKLHLENNKIYTFSDLRNLSGLKEVCVFGNTLNSTLGLDFLFGVNGALNSPVFTTLNGKGVIVRNVDHASNYVDRSGNDKTSKVIKSMTSISYPKIIGKNEDISVAYKHLSLKYTDYVNEKLSTFGGYEDYLTVNYYKGENNNFTATTATTFTLSYTYKISYWLFFSQEITFDIDFDIIRV